MERRKLCWQEVSVATPIPELVVCPDPMQLFMFSAVTWNRHHIHYSKDAAVREGWPDVVVQRGLLGNFLSRLITNWVADAAQLRRLSWRVTRPVVPGEKIICRGRITEKTEALGQKYLICAVSASSAKEELIASGDATVVFP